MAFRPNKSFRDIIDDLGLSTGIQLCLDAGDIASYPGSGQKWLDRGQGYDFFLGPDGTVTATDPTFTGTAGDLKDSTYWGFDGTQFFRYDSANEAWMQNLHKDNAKFTIAGWLVMADLTSVAGICGTRGASTNTGISFHRQASGVGNVLTIGVQNAGATVLGFNGTAGATSATAWTFVALSLDEAIGANGGILQVNGTQELFTSTYASPSAGNASFTLELGTRGNADNPLPNLSRMGAMMIWNRALSAAELMSLYQYPGLVFSDTGGQRQQNRMVSY